MTVKELYDFAVEHGVEDRPCLIDYFAEDGWYSLYDYEFFKEDLEIDKDGILRITLGDK